MSVLVARLLNVWQEMAIEFQRFVLLWRYQHYVPAFTLWWRLILKRIIDIFVGIIGLIVAAPVMAAIALAIKLDSQGPIVYVQERVGRFGDLFFMYKFRTMQLNAETAGPVWSAGEDDPRMTRIGRFLRRTHLDELPQLVNVLYGQMSLVGPRPERPLFVEKLNNAIDKYGERLLLKPGMTGLAQVHYRYDTTLADVKRKVRFDRLYIRRMCIGLDARILVWTFMVVVTGRGIR